jgi:hypothetical protein
MVDENRIKNDFVETYQRFNVESLSWHNGGNVFLGKSLKDGSFSGVIETEDKNTSFFVISLQSSK